MTPLQRSTVPRAGHRPRSRAVVVAVLAWTLGLAGCSSRPAEPFLDCVPYARGISGVSIYGDAWTWWDGARGRYQRGQKPREGGVLALRRTERLRQGHVAVVARVVGPREIRVDHANWGNDAATRGRVYRDMAAIDVSPANDWTEVRFWNGRAAAYGSVYPAHGFIYPLQERAAGIVQLALEPESADRPGRAISP